MLSALLLSCLLVPGRGLAGPHDNARFALHATDPFTPSKANPTPCSLAPLELELECASFEVQRPAPSASTIYVVAAQLGSIGILGASCGVEYAGGPGVGINPALVTWTGCSDGLEFPNGPPGEPERPAPGGGIRVTWVTCQNRSTASGVQATLGAFYVYAYDPSSLSLTPNNNQTSGPELALDSCSGGTTNLLDNYYPPSDGYLRFVLSTVGFGDNQDVWNACWSPPAVTPTTWGTIKTRFRGQEAGQ